LAVSCSPNAYGPDTPDGAVTPPADAGARDGAKRDSGTKTHDSGPPNDDDDDAPPGDDDDDDDATAPPGAVHAGAFTHSGILVTDAQLAFLKQQIAAGAEPW